MNLEGLGHPDAEALAKETFSPHVSSLASIRAFVKRWGEEAGLDPEKTSRIQLAVAEASANAMDHSKEKGDITLWTWRTSERFTVDVFGAGEFRAKSGRAKGHRGLGLPLMVASADEVSFASLPEGAPECRSRSFSSKPPRPALGARAWGDPLPPTTSWKLTLRAASVALPEARQYGLLRPHVLRLRLDGQ